MLFQERSNNQITLTKLENMNNVIYFLKPKYFSTFSQNNTRNKELLNKCIIHQCKN